MARRNDEGLYNWWKLDTKLSKRNFIRQNRTKIDEIIDATKCRKRIPHAWLTERGEWHIPSIGRKNT